MCTPRSGTPQEAITEYRYDCNGNLESLWDANHDSASDPPTQSYTYDRLDRLTAIAQPWATGQPGEMATTTYALWNTFQDCNQKCGKLCGPDEPCSDQFQSVAAGN